VLGQTAAPRAGRPAQGESVTQIQAGP
jgi:hypothetical protein